MQYKINQSIRVRYLELNKTTGITDLKIIVQPPTGSELSQISMTEVDGQGIYEASFTPDAIGWWWVRVKSVTYPLNVYSKSYYVGTTDDPYPLQEEGKVKITDGSIDATVHDKTTDAKGLNSLPLGKSTGLYYPLLDEEKHLISGDTFPLKTNADGLQETRSAVLTDEGSLYDTFKGTVLDSEWTQVLGTGASASVANSRYILNSGTTANSESYLCREVDYSPLRITGKIAISQRITNQDIYFGLADGMNPANDIEFARFHFTGTTGTLTRCETQSSLDTNGNEGLSEDFTIETTTNYLEYTIIMASGRVIFQIRDSSGTISILTTRMKELPDIYSILHLRLRIKNGAIAPTSSTSVTMDVVKIFNYNDVSIVNLSERPISVDQVANYSTKSLSEIVDTIIPINTDYWLLNLQAKQGIIDEIHIITDNSSFTFKINTDGVNFFDEKGSDLDAQYLLDNASNNCKNIGTNATGTTLDWVLPIYFTKSIQIGISNTVANKKLKGYIIIYREKL